MWIVVWHIALLACVAVIAWRVAKVDSNAAQTSATIQKVDKAVERLIKFLDERDSGLRIEGANASRKRDARERVVDDWMEGQSRSLEKVSVVSVQLLKLWSGLEEEALAPNRSTVEMPSAPASRFAGEARERASWEELKRQGLIGRCVVHSRVDEAPSPGRQGSEGSP